MCPIATWLCTVVNKQNLISGCERQSARFLTGHVHVLRRPVHGLWEHDWSDDRVGQRFGQQCRVLLWGVPGQQCQPNKHILHSRNRMWSLLPVQDWPIIRHSGNILYLKKKDVNLLLKVSMRKDFKNIF